MDNGKEQTSSCPGTPLPSTASRLVHGPQKERREGEGAGGGGEKPPKYSTVQAHPLVVLPFKRSLPTEPMAELSQLLSWKNS